MTGAIFEAVRTLLTDRPETLNLMWVFIAGSTVALLRSLVDGSRRTFGRLILACVFGGFGAMAADRVFHDSSWHIFLVGAAAVITENLVIGLFKASSQFKEEPIEVFKDLWKAIVPSLSNFSGIGKSDDKAEDKKTEQAGNPAIYDNDNSDAK